MKADLHCSSSSVYQAVPTSDKLPSQRVTAEFEREICYRLPRRYTVCGMTFVGVLILFAMRLNLSVAVVSMTSSRDVKLDNGTILEVKEFDWSSKEKGYILSSFYYGYILAEFCSGWLSHRFGGRNIFGLELAFAGLFTMAIPVIANYGPYAILIFRALAGVFEGGLYPSTQSIWSNWAPKNERTRLATWSYNGTYAAAVLCFPLYGLMATYWGWQTLFYVPGAVSVLWSIVWFLNVKNDPIEDAGISEEELRYIKNGLETTMLKRKVPWDQIFTSMPFWSIVVVHITQSWGYIVMFTFFPSYMKDVWQVTEEKSGLLLMIPTLVGVLVMPTVGIISDYFEIKKQCSRTKIRKCCQLIAGFGSAIAVALVAISPSPILAICSFILFECVDPFVFGSYYMSPLDIAANYAGVITGIVCTAGSFSGVISPVIITYIVQNETKAEWSTAFLVSSAVNIGGTIFYIIFARAETQSWAV